MYRWTNFTANLASTHTAFILKHNQIADELKRMNRHWDDERVFQVSIILHYITLNYFT